MKFKGCDKNAIYIYTHLRLKTSRFSRCSFPWISILIIKNFRQTSNWGNTFLIAADFETCLQYIWITKKSHRAEKYRRNLICYSQVKALPSSALYSYRTVFEKKGKFELQFYNILILSCRNACLNVFIFVGFSCVV